MPALDNVVVVGSAGLPPDLPRGAALQRATVWQNVPDDVHAGILALASERRIDLRRILGAAFALLLTRYTNETAFCLRSLVSASTALESTFADDATYDVLLERTRDVERVSGTVCSPMAFDVVHDEDVDGRREIDAHDDVALTVVASDRELLLQWSYDRGRFERPTIERLGTTYQRLLRAAIASPDAPIAALSIMTASERADVIRLGRGERRPYERDSTIQACFTHVAEATPNALAIVSDDGTLTYGELNVRSNRLAHYIRSRGVRAHDSVGVALERSLDVAVVILAILKAGAAYVPLDLGYPSERLRFMIEDAGIGLIVSDAASLTHVPALGTSIIAIDEERGVIAAQAATPLVVDLAADSRAYVMYTSGSSGRAKGVAVTHRGVVRLVRNTDFQTMASGDVCLQYAPIAFDASTLEIWAPLLNGARLAIPAPGALSIGELGRVIERFGVTMLWLTAAMFRTVVDDAPATLGALRQVITGGDVVSPVHARRFIAAFPRTRLVNGYGPTENTTFSTTYCVASLDTIGARVPIGRPIANSSAYVVDARRELVPIGMPGELCVGGDGVASGYIGLDELTAQRFVADPFSDRPGARMYRTGDRARWRADGVLEFLGRADHQVKIRGYRVELQEIEAGLLACEAVRGAAVVAIEAASDKTAVAFVVPAAAASVEVEQLRAQLAARLPSYMIPQRFVIVAQLPTHPSGKLDRVALERAAQEPVAPLVPSAPAIAPTRCTQQSSLRSAVGAVWRDVLRVSDAPGLDMNFFDAGGDSLLLLTLQARLQEITRAPICVMDLFEHTTIRSIATFLEGSRHAEH